MSLLYENYEEVESRHLSYWHNNKKVEVPVISCKFQSSTINVAKNKNSPDYVLFNEVSESRMPFAIRTRKLSIKEAARIIKIILNSNSKYSIRI